jgi:hypothetical protein
MEASSLVPTSQNDEVEKILLDAASKELSDKEQKDLDEWYKQNAAVMKTAMSDTLKEIMDGGVKK